MAARLAGTRTLARRRRVATPVTVAFLVASVGGAVSVAVLGGPSGPLATAAVAAAVAVTLVSGILAPAVLPPPWRDGLTPLVSLLPALALHVTSGPEGADDLPTIAVAWLGLVGTRLQVVLALLVLAGQRLLLPVPAGTVVTTRDLALSVAVVAVAATVALTVNTWLSERDLRDARVRETTDLLGQVAVTRRAVRAGLAGRAELCEAACRVAGVDRALLFEPHVDGGLHATVVTDDDGAVLRVPAERDSSVVAAVLHDGTRRFAADPRELDGADPSLSHRFRGTSLLWEPVVHGETVLGVLVIGWDGRVEQPTPRAGRAVTMIADELAVLLQAELLADRAHTDELTGLPNRRVWNQRAADTLRLRRSTHDDVVVALLDLDHFKAYNDRHGHVRGDELLAEFARCASAELRRSDVLIRWGGEEFVVLLPGCTLADAAPAVDRLRAVVPDGQTCSAGLAQWDGLEDPTRLLARADRALYRAKAQGRDRLVVDDPTVAPEDRAATA